VSAGREATAAGEPLVLLRMGPVGVLVAQREVHSVESRSRLGAAAGAVGSCGTLQAEDAPWPVYCLDERLSPTSLPAEGARICVLLRGGSGLLGVMVDEVLTDATRTWRTGPVPECMHLPGTPLAALAVAEGAVHGVLSAPALAASLGAAVTTAGGRPAREARR
jgi:hypothetical protein